MRKITQLATQAFLSSTPFSMNNTEVIIRDDDSVLLTLHGSTIAHKNDSGTIEISNAGYKTNVTKERLNGIPGVRIQQKAGTWYLNGTEWDGTWTTI